jgi:hypothetical protein
MISVPYVSIGMQALKGVRAVRSSRRWLREVGEIVTAAIGRTLCPRSPRASELEAIVNILAGKLSRVEVPGRETTGRLRRAWRRAGRAFGRGVLPRMDVVGPTFAEYLKSWMLSALDPDVLAALKGVECQVGEPMSVSSIPNAFPSAFLMELYPREEAAEGLSEARLELIKELVIADVTRCHIRRGRAQGLATLTALSAAGGGGITLAADQAFGLSDPLAAATWIGGAAVTAGATYLFRSRHRSRGLLIGDMVSSWISDLISEGAPESSPLRQRE